MISDNIFKNYDGQKMKPKLLKTSIEAKRK